MNHTLGTIGKMIYIIVNFQLISICLIFQNDFDDTRAVFVWQGNLLLCDTIPPYHVYFLEIHIHCIVSHNSLQH